MKNSKIKIFVVWLIAISFLFGNLSLGSNVFANGTPGEGTADGGKDISTRIKWLGDKTNFSTNSGGITTPIVVNGKLRTDLTPQQLANIKQWRAVGMEYYWEIPEGEALHKGDYFELNILDGHFFGKLAGKTFDLEGTKDGNPVIFGTYTFIQDNATKALKLRATLNEQVEGFNSMQNGNFKFAAELFSFGDLRIGFEGQDPAVVHVNEPIVVINPMTNGSILTKGGDTVPNDSKILWTIQVAFDELVNYFKTDSIKHRKDIVVYDVLPKGATFEFAKMRTTYYVPLAEGEKKNQLGTNYMHSTDIDFPSAVIRETTDRGVNGIRPFINKIKEAGRNEPTVGVLTYRDQQNEERTLIVVGLGTSPSTYDHDYGSYAGVFTKSKAMSTTPLETFLDTRLNHEDPKAKITQDQYNVMMSKYAGKGGNPYDGKIRAWNLIFHIKVAQVDSKYENTAAIEWVDYDPNASGGGSGGGGTPAEPKPNVYQASSLMNYSSSSGSVQVLKRTSFIVRKEWDGKPADKAEFEVYADGKLVPGSRRALFAPDWKVTVNGLPLENPDGSAIAYTVKEIPIEGYESSIKPGSNIQKGFTIVNKEKTGEKVDVKVTKIWDGTEQNSVNVTLIGKVGTEEVVKREATIYKHDGWVYTFLNLPKNNASGDLIAYEVLETQIPGYYPPVYNTVKENEFTITNKEIPNIPKTDVVIRKVWKGARQADARVTLYQSVGAGEKTKVGDTIILNTGNNWSHTFHDLAKQDENGNEVNYSVEETPIAGYVVNHTVDKTENLTTITVTNMEQPLNKILIPVTKKWVGDPAEKVTIILNKMVGGNPVKVTEVELNETNKWNHVFEVDKADADGDISYEIEEVKLDGYTVNIEKDPVSGAYTVTNTKKAPDT
ncbi:MAG: Cna B-type domain-containing protein, partial [Bacillota bacterium]|nr:Cna B-type domain-containing protein [Bacillota bacterium]